MLLKHLKSARKRFSPWTPALRSHFPYVQPTVSDEWPPVLPPTRLFGSPVLDAAIFENEGQSGDFLKGAGKREGNRVIDELVAMLDDTLARDSIEEGNKDDRRFGELAAKRRRKQKRQKYKGQKHKTNEKKKQSKPQLVPKDERLDVDGNELPLPPPPPLPNVEWIQCEVPDCRKWRKLPLFCDPESLPDPFFCRHLRNVDKRQADCCRPEMKWKKGTTVNYEIGTIQVDQLQVGQYIDAFCRLIGVGWTEAQVICVEHPGQRQGECNAIAIGSPKSSASSSSSTSTTSVTTRALLRYARRTNGKYQPDDEWVDHNTPQIALRLAPHGTMCKPKAKWLSFNQQDSDLVKLFIQDCLEGIIEVVEATDAAEKKAATALKRQRAALARKSAELERVLRRSTAYAGRMTGTTRQVAAVNKSGPVAGRRKKTRVIKRRPPFRFFCKEMRARREFSLLHRGNEREKKKALRASYAKLTPEERAVYKLASQQDKKRYVREIECERCIHDMISMIIEPDPKKRAIMLAHGTEEDMAVQTSKSTSSSSSNGFLRALIKSGKPEQNLSPFLVFSHTHRHEVVAHFERITGKKGTLSVTDLEAKLRELWLSLKEQQRHPYLQESAKLKQLYSLATRKYEQDRATRSTLLSQSSLSSSLPSDTLVGGKTVGSSVSAPASACAVSIKTEHDAAGSHDEHLLHTGQSAPMFARGNLKNDGAPAAKKARIESAQACGNASTPQQQKLPQLQPQLSPPIVSAAVGGQRSFQGHTKQGSPQVSSSSHVDASADAVLGPSEILAAQADNLDLSRPFRPPLKVSVVGEALRLVRRRYTTSRRRRRGQAHRRKRKRHNESSTDDDNSDSDSDSDSSDSGGRRRRTRKQTTTGWVIFCKERRAGVQAEQPGLSFGEISKHLSTLWKALGPKGQAPFSARAKAFNDAQPEPDSLSESEVDSEDSYSDSDDSYSDSDDDDNTHDDETGNDSDSDGSDYDSDDDRKPGFSSLPASLYSLPPAKRPRTSEVASPSSPVLEPGRHKGRIYVARDDETPLSIAQECGVNVHALVKLNKITYPGLMSKSKLIRYTQLKLPPTPPGKRR